MTDTQQQQTETPAAEPRTPSIPEGEYAGRLVEVSEMQETTGENKSLFRNVTCRIDEDGPLKGKRIGWTAYLTEKAGVRSYEAFVGSGCTFPSGDPDDFTGLGSKEQSLTIKHEPFEFTPKPTESDPTPGVVRGIRARVAFVNSGPQGMRGQAVSDGRRAVVKPQLQSFLHKARTGDRSSGPDAQGNRVDSAGTLQNAQGKKLF